MICPQKWEIIILEHRRKWRAENTDLSNSWSRRA